VDLEAAHLSLGEDVCLYVDHFFFLSPQAILSTRSLKTSLQRLSEALCGALGIYAKLNIYTSGKWV
jgi:hypothetical protein